MKEKAIIFIIGLLLGAIIATGSVLVYSKSVANNSSDNQQMQMPGGTPPEMPSNQNGENGQPLEMPSNNEQSSSEQSNN